MSRFWFDTEFIDDGHSVELISIGIVSDDGRELYAEVEFDRSKAGDWLKENVLPQLTGVTTRKSMLKDKIFDFMGEKPEIWGYYADYDWVVLCQLYGSMMSLPGLWPMYCRDVKQLCDDLGNPKLPPKGVQHHALADAKWTKEAWEFLDALRRSRWLKMV
jgi:hypothetical protein